MCYIHIEQPYAVPFQFGLYLWLYSCSNFHVLKSARGSYSSYISYLEIVYFLNVSQAPFSTDFTSNDITLLYLQYLLHSVVICSHSVVKIVMFMFVGNAILHVVKGKTHTRNPLQHVTALDIVIECRTVKL